MLEWIPANVHYNLCYRQPIGYVITMSYGIPGRSKSGSVQGRGATIVEAVLHAMGRAECPECGRAVVFEPMAELAFCAACVGYIEKSHVQWSNLKTITPTQERAESPAEQEVE